MIYLTIAALTSITVMILYVRHEDKKLQAEMDIEKRLYKQYEERVKKDRIKYANKVIAHCLNQIES